MLGSAIQTIKKRVIDGIINKIFFLPSKYCLDDESLSQSLIVKATVKCFRSRQDKVQCSFLKNSNLC